ncbi:hypothetical protein JTE90_018021 [Oedothorax gibbosus]|uniref:Bromo domain-containing protein n=1 Tax=Oedothorax gibbosus TaxID=931172 RepID=A0AAV6V8E0_9ARAC|nr:hypothetical protein JTE90_018021 [Oedothorax gibbosus]
MTSEQATKEVEDLKKEIQCMHLLPSTAQFVSLYRFAFKLPEIEIEELEDGILELNKVGGKVLQDLLVALARGIYPSRGVNASNLEEHINRLLKKFWRLEKPDQEPLPEGKTFSQLDVQTKVEFLHFLCCQRVDKPDAESAMKTMDADALRVQPLGCDDEGNKYWYFFGTRLYKQEPAKAKDWKEEWNHQKELSFNKRGRGRPRKCKQRKSDEECDEFEDMSTNGNNMNVDEKSLWSIVCNTIEDWVDFAEKLKGSKSKNEKSLFQTVTDNFLPVLIEIYQEKERRLQQKLRELVPERVITRRETRKSRVKSIQEQNGYDAETAHREHLARDRAQRLEERNRRLTQSAEKSKSRSRRDKYVDEEEDESADEDYFRDVDDESLPQSEESFDYRKAYIPIVSTENTDLKSQVLKVLSEVKLHKDAWPFLYAVEETYAPGYYEIITDPMDLSTLTNKLLDNAYKTIGHVDEDFKRMVDNCKLYNGESSGMTNMVMNLWRVFRRGMSKIGNPQTQTPNAPSSRTEPVFRTTEFPKEAEGDSNDYQMKKSSDSSDGRRRKRKKIKHMDAIELLSQQAKLSVEKSSGSENEDQQPRQMSLYSDLKIVPIHSHPASLMEKYSDTSNNEMNDLDASASSYHEPAPEQDKESAAKDSMPYFAPNADINAISDIISKNSGKGFNILSDGENHLLSDHEAELQQARSASYDNVSRSPKTSSPLGGVDQGGNCDNMPGLPREAIYSTDGQRVSPVNPSVSPNNASYPSQSPPNTFAMGRNATIAPEGQRANDMTTVDASALGISSYGQYNSSVSGLNQLSQSMESFPSSNPFAKVVQSSPKNKPRYSPTFAASNQDFQGSFQFQPQRPNSGEHPTTMASSFASQQSLQVAPQQTNVKSFQNMAQIQVANQQTLKSFQNQTQVQVAPQQSTYFQNPGNMVLTQNPDPNKFPTMKVSLPPSTGELLVVPGDPANSGVTFHLFAQPHSNPAQPIQSHMQVFRDGTIKNLSNHSATNAADNQVSTIMKAPSKEDNKGNMADPSQKRKSPVQSSLSPNTIQQPTTLPYQLSPTTRSFPNLTGQQPRYSEAAQTSTNTVPSFTNTSLVRPNAVRYHNPNTAFTSASEVQSSSKPNTLRQHPSPNTANEAQTSSNLFLQSSSKPNALRQHPSPNTAFTSANETQTNLFLQNPATYQTTIPQVFPSYSYRQASVNVGNATTVTTNSKTQPKVSLQKVFVQGPQQNSVIQNGNGQFILLSQQTAKDAAKRSPVGEQKGQEVERLLPRTIAEPGTTASFYQAGNNVFTLQTAPGNPSQMYAQVLPNQLPQYVNQDNTASNKKLLSIVYFVNSFCTIKEIW